MTNRARLLVRCSCLSLVMAAPIGIRCAAAQTVGVLVEPGNLGSGARAMGMGGAFVAVADDATAASWNPAGLSTLGRPEVSFVHDFTRIGNNFAATTTSNTSNGALVTTGAFPAYSFVTSSNNPDFASFTYPFAAGRWKIAPQFSYRRALKTNLSSSITRGPNVTTNGTDRNANGVFETTEVTTATSSISTSTNDAKGGVDVYAATVGFSFDPRVHIGVALNFWRGDGSSHGVSSNQATLITGTGTAVSTNVTTDTEDTRSAKSVDVGVLFKPMRQLSVGAVFRSGFSMPRTFRSSSAQSYSPTTPAGSTASTSLVTETTITWPRTAAFGAAFTPIDALTIALDYTFTNWSSATVTGTSTNQANFNPGPGTTQRPPTTTTTAVNSSYPYVPLTGTAPQVDSHQLRGGAEFLARRSTSGAFVGIPIRGGVYQDKQFQPQLDGSSLNSTGLTAGAGVLWRQVSVDVAFVHQSVSGLLAASTSFEITNGTQTLKRADQNEAVFNRLILSTTVRF